MPTDAPGQRLLPAANLNVGSSGSDDLLAIDDIIVWTGFITGIIGTVVATVTLVWQLLQWRTARKERGILTLNAHVLKPWSDVTVTSVGGWPDGIELFVPRNAFPPEVAPKIPDEGLPLSKLTGLFQAQMYLSGHPEHKDIWSLEVQADQALRKYNDARRERHRFVETMVTEGMAVAYPDLTAATSQETPEAESYWLSQVIRVVERMSYQFDAYGILNVQMSKSTMNVGGVARWSLTEQNSMPLLVGVSESRVDDGKLKALLVRWIQDQRLSQHNLKMREARAELDASLQEFRTKLKELCLRIDQSGG